jgi:hypothetical protein
LDDQAKTLMPRQEALFKFAAMDDKLAAIVKTFEDRLALKDTDIQSLRESRSEGGGKSAAVSMVWGIAIAILGILIAVAGLFLRR